MTDDKSAGAFTSLETHGIDPNNPETWRAHLTPELKSNFESKGVSIVESEVTRRVYQDDRKHFAALYWLETKRSRKRLFTIWALSLTTAGVLFAALRFFFG